MQKIPIIIHLNKYEKWIDILLWLTIAIIPIAILPIKIPDIFDLIKGPLLVLSGLSILVLLVLNKKWDNSIVVWLLCGYLFWVFLSSVFSVNPLLSFAGATINAGRFEGFATILIYGILFYASRNYFVITAKKVILTLSVLSFVALYSLIQYYEFDPLVIYRNYRPMVFSTIGNQNFLGSLMVMLTGVTLGLSIFFKKWYYFLFFALFLSSLLAAQTRGAWIASGFVFVGMSVFVFSYKWEFIFSYLLSVMLIIGVYYGLNFTKNNAIQKRSNTIKREISLNNEYGGSGRIKIWEITWHVIQNHPILGTGPENLKTIVHLEHKKEIDEYYRVKKTSFDKAHNEYLHIAAVSGIPSLLIYFTILFLVFKQNILNMKRDIHYSIATLAIMGYLIQSFSNISVIAVAPIFWILLGFVSQKTKGVY
jgi:putative inorganic carbon (HCO3(-)) transporter